MTLIIIQSKSKIKVFNKKVWLLISTKVQCINFSIKTIQSSEVPLLLEIKAWTIQPRLGVGQQIFVQISGDNTNT
jgi:hypothetical protein